MRLKPDGTRSVSLFDHYKPLTPIEPYRISVPTKGVFAEAVQGACNACEKIETDRLQDWNRFPTPTNRRRFRRVTRPRASRTGKRLQGFRAADCQHPERAGAPGAGEGLAGLGISRQDRRVQGHHRAGGQPAQSSGPIYRTRRTPRRLARWPRKWPCSAQHAEQRQDHGPDRLGED